MTTATRHLDELAKLTAKLREERTELALLEEQHATTRRELQQAERDLADGGSDDAADRVNRLRARLKGEPGKEKDVSVEAKETPLRAQHKRAQEAADQYRRDHAAALADEMMPEALAARDELLAAFRTLQEAARKWDAIAREFMPIVKAADLHPLKAIPHNPMRDALNSGKDAASLLERAPHNGVPAPWQAIPDSEITWPTTSHGTVIAGGAQRPAASLKAERAKFRGQ